MKKKLLLGLAVVAGILGLYAAVMLFQHFAAPEAPARRSAPVAAPAHPAAAPKTNIATFSRSPMAKRLKPQGKAAHYRLARAVPVEKAAAGAISGSKEGLQDLQDYFDASAGHEKNLKKRADNLLGALGKNPAAQNPAAITLATQRLLAAFRRSATAAYEMPLYVDGEFKLGLNQTGWDFGPDGKKPYIGFVRVGPGSSDLAGHSLNALQSSKASKLLNDGILEVTGFGAKMKAGTYQVYLVAGNLPDPSPAPLPFGNGIKTNGVQLDLVDMSDGSFGGYGLLSPSGIDIIGLQDKPENDASDPAARVKPFKNMDVEGKIVATHAFLEGDTLRIELDDPAIGKSYISGIIVGPSDLDQLDKQIQDDIAAFLQGIEPASGTFTAPKKQGFRFSYPLPVGSALTHLPEIASHYATEFGNLLSGGSGSGGSGSSGGSNCAASKNCPGEGSSGSGSSGGSSGSTGASSGSTGASSGSTGASSGSTGASSGSTGASSGSTGASSGSTGASSGSTGASSGSTGASSGSTGASSGSTGASSGSTGASSGSTGASSGSTGASSGSTGASSGSTGASSGSTGASSGSTGASSGSTGASSGSTGASSGSTGASSGTTGASSGSTGASSGSTGASSGSTGASSGSTGASSGSTGASSGSTGASSGSTGASSGSTGASSGSTGASSGSTGASSGSTGASSGSTGASSGSTGASSGSTGASSGSTGASSGSTGASSGSTGASSGSTGASSGSTGASSGSTGASSGSTGASSGSTGASSGSTGASSGSTGASSGSTGASSGSTGASSTSSSGGDSSSSSSGPGGQGEHVLVANAGPDLSGPLGGTFSLDFCQSTFDSASLCSFTAPYLQQNFTIQWLLGSNSLGYATTPAPFSLDTSLFPELFNAANNYLISLDITYLGGVTPLSSKDNMVLTLAAPNIIPEPEGIAIFLAGLGGLVFALRRKK